MGYLLALNLRLLETMDEGIGEVKDRKGKNENIGVVKKEVMKVRAGELGFRILKFELSVEIGAGAGKSQKKFFENEKVDTSASTFLC